MYIKAQTVGAVCALSRVMSEFIFKKLFYLVFLDSIWTKLLKSHVSQRNS